MESDDKIAEELIKRRCKEISLIISSLSESSSYGLLLFARGLLKSEKQKTNT